MKKDKNNPFYGRKHTEETRKKMSKNHADIRGVNNPNWKGGLPKCISCGQKISRGSNQCKKCRMIGSGNPMFGKQRTLETKEKIRNKLIGKKNPHKKNCQCIFCKVRRKELSGKNNPSWKGGITPYRKKIRQSARYKEWRTRIFERDNYTCQKCKKRGKYLNAHHIKPFSKFPKLRFDIKNGISFCKECHEETKKYPNILITGSSGFIGQYLVEKLKKEGYIVYEIDSKNGKDQNLLNINSKYFKWLENCLRPNAVICHLAARSMVRHSVEDPDLSLENMGSTYNVLEFARRKKIKKIIFASSREVYGNQELKTCKETDSRTWFTESPYSASKSCGEAMLAAYKTCYGIDYVTVRLSNVFGLNDPNDRFIPRLFEWLPENKKFEVYGKDKKMDFTYIDDCIDGFMVTIKNFKKLANQEIPIYNIAYGKSEKLLDVALYLKELFNSKSKIKVTKNHTGEVVKYQANINKFKKLTGWTPKYNVFKGLQKMYEDQ
jgi:UDP-glucose 4-epimerase